MAGRVQSIDTEALFQTKTIVQIREVEAHTRHEIEDKKRQLRQVVGDSYRDLIASADTIVAISQQCHAVASALDSLDGKVAAMSQAVESSRSKDQEQTDTSSFDKLFAVGSRIKYLIDCPETIYGCLDSREFLEAARRYVRAVEVHRSFTSNSKSTAQRFPLLHHQWPLVKKLGAETWDRAVAWLLAQGGASPRQLADVLFGLALLRPVDGAEALKHHLAARQAYIVSCLSASVTEGEAPPDPDAVGVILADVVALVCTTVAQCGDLFLTRPGVTAQPLLLRVGEQEDSGATELLFDPGSGKESSETIAWRERQAGACERLSSLSSAGVALECSQWVEGLSTHIAPLCLKLLEGCNSGAALRSVEHSVRETLSEWRYIVGADTPSTTRTSSSEQGTPASSHEELSWSDACQWVAGRPMSLWPLLLEGPLLSRVQALIADELSAATSTVEQHAADVVQISCNLASSLPGVVNSGSWSDTLDLDLGPETPPLGGTEARHSSAGAVARRKSSNTSSHSTVRDLSVDGTAVASGDLEWWKPRAEVLLTAVDSKLQAALAAALDSSDSTDAATAPGTAPAPVSTSSSSQRALVIQPFVQDKCSQAVEDIATALEAAAASLPQPSSDEEGFSQAVGAALFVGRVALGIAERSAPLRTLLGPPSAWLSSRKTQDRFRRPGLGSAGSSTDGAEPTPRLSAAQRRLHSVAADAYGLWAAWAARGVAQQLIVNASKDAALAAKVPLRGWEEATVSAPDEAGGQVKFWLPATPSPVAMTAALSACAEVERAGGHRADGAPVQQLRWQLAGEVCASFAAALAPGGALAAPGAVSEKGVLQLIFDVRFLTTLLTGPSPPGVAAGAASSAAASRKRQVSELEGSLVGRIDPIDWATYESRLYSNVTAFIQRSKILLGLAMRGSAPTPASDRPVAAAVQPAESNVLLMASAGPRFVYLPVNTPSAMRQRSSQHAVPASTMTLLDSGEASQYSFASLTSHRAGEQRAVAAAAAAAVAGKDIGASGAGSVGASALEALRQTSFGALLGDRAAEVGASLGDSFSFSSLSQGGSGLLSSLQNLPSFKR